jgi:hypothetical protein
MKPNRKHTAGTDFQSPTEITEESNNYTDNSGEPSGRNARIAFMRGAGNMARFVMVRPDRPQDAVENRYATPEDRSRGERALRLWFEYFAQKGWISTMRGTASMLSSGYSVMFVCDDPHDFDIVHMPPMRDVIPSSYWREWELSKIQFTDRYEDDGSKERIIAGLKELTKELKSSDFSINNARSNPSAWHDPAEDRAADDLAAERIKTESRNREKARERASLAAMDPTIVPPRLSDEVMAAINNDADFL